MRKTLAAALILLIAVPAAAKPGAGGVPDETRRAMYRAQGMAVCVGSTLPRRDQGIEPADVSRICGCAVDRLMAGRAADAPAPMGDSDFREAVYAQVTQCAGAAVGGKLVEAGSDQAAPADDIATPNAQSPDVLKSAGADFLAWIEGTGLPLWAWGAILVLGFGFVRLMFRRREGEDLIGPPPSMRSEKSVQPRRPENFPPQR
jgi:hypothetical protein